MKKISSKRKEFLDRKSRLNPIRLSIRRRRRRSGGSSFHANFHTIRAPRVFTLSAHKFRNELISFLDDLRTELVDNNSSVLIDFTFTEKMDAGGTLLFTSELRRSLALAAEDVRARCIPPRHHKIRQILKQIGIFSLLNYKADIVPHSPDVVHWKYASGYQVDGQKYENVLGAYDGRVADALLDSLFRGISEAMTNCHHHAYIDSREDGLSKQPQTKDWWMFSQEKNGMLSVAFCDLGVGIPNTIPRKRPALWRRIISMGHASNDGKIIQEAIEDSISRTGQHNRGKGLKQLLEATQLNGNGRLRIYSNRGRYSYEQQQGRTREYATSILGTLILWSVPILPMD